MRQMIALSLCAFLAGCAKSETSAAGAESCEADPYPHQYTYSNSGDLKSEYFECTVNGHSCEVIRAIRDHSIYETDCPSPFNPALL